MEEGAPGLLGASPAQTHPAGDAVLPTPEDVCGWGRGGQALPGGTAGLRAGNCTPLPPNSPHSGLLGAGVGILGPPSAHPQQGD